MNIDRALAALASLSQETRLRLLRLLIQYGETGVPAGFLSQELGIPHNTLSFHLAHLSRAGLVTSQRQGRSILYAANCTVVEDLITFLTENCCAREKDASCGRPSARSDLCAPRGKARGRKSKLFKCV